MRAQISSLRQNVLAFFGGIASIQQAVSALSTALTGASACVQHPARMPRPSAAAGKGTVNRLCVRECQFPQRLVLAGVDLNNIGLGDVNVSSNVGSELASAASTLDSVVNGGDSVAASLNKYGIVGLDNARAKYQPRSLKVRRADIRTP